MVRTMSESVERSSLDLRYEGYDSFDYMTKQQGLIWLGPTGCDKTGLATAFLLQAIDRRGANSAWRMAVIPAVPKRRLPATDNRFRLRKVTCLTSWARRNCGSLCKSTAGLSRSRLAIRPLPWRGARVYTASTSQRSRLRVSGSNAAPTSRTWRPSVAYFSW